MAIDYGGKTFNLDWQEIDAMGNPVGGVKKNVAANADWAANTGGQNPYTNQPGASPWDTSGNIPGNEAGSTMPKGAAPGGYLDTAKMQAYQRSLQTLYGLGGGGAPSGGATSGGGSTAGPSFPTPTQPYDPNQNFILNPASRVSATASSQFGGGSPSSSTFGAPSDADRIRDAYRSFLGREASDAEVSGWTSGGYGGGGIDGWVQQIQNSHEAQQRTVGPRPGESGPQMPVDGPGGGSAPPTGAAYEQIAEALRRMISGAPATTSPSAPAAPASGAMPPGGFQQWFQGLMGGKPSSPEGLAALEGQLAQYGIKLQKDSAGKIRGRLFLPDGRAVDVVSQWGQPWTWIDRGMGSGDGSAGSSTGGQGFGANVPGSQYSDPYSQLLEQLLGGRISQLSQPMFDPNRAMYEQSLKDRATQLGQAEKPYQQLLDYLQTRFKDLQGPGYTGAENEVIRTGALDPIETDRTAAKKRVIERLSARGLTPDSGIYQDALLQVDKAFDGFRGTTQTALTTNDLNRREDRQQRAESIGGQLVDIPEGRKREQLDVFSALEMLSNSARQEDSARSREAIGYGGALSDLGPQRLQLAMQAAGMGGTPDSMFDNLLGLGQLNQNSAIYQNSRQNNLWSGLGQISYALSNMGRK